MALKSDAPFFDCSIFRTFEKATRQLAN